MSITLGSNIASLRGQRQLTKTSDELGTVFERLSSGQRINRASDDAAGLAIADSLKADSRILNQGVRNLGDGLSLLVIADAAIENLSSIVIRLEELAVQSANGVYSGQQRKALDGEAQALKDEFFRISKVTEFNGQKLLTGENPIVSLQAGVGDDAILQTSVGGAIGTGEFDGYSPYDVGTSPWAVITGDFNGDGLSDLATADVGPDTVSVLLATGSGGFGAATAYTAAGVNTYEVATGDFNGDGFLDLATADQLGDTSILIGDGSGGFGAATRYDVGNSFPRRIRTGDFNGDGFDDLVVFATELSVLLADGSGGFGAATIFSVAANIKSIATGDVNGDGILDLVTADYDDDTISVLQGTGNGGFGAAVAYGVGTDPYSVALDDIDGDGILDLAVAEAGDNTTSVLRGDGSGGFALAGVYSVGVTPVAVAIGDFNGDGSLDLATADLAAETSVLLGNGSGGFGVAVTYSVDATPFSIATGDFDGDGVLDLVTGSVTTNNTSVLLGSSIEGVAPLLEFSLKTLADARQALPIFKRKREQLAAQRGEIGANQARIEVATNVLTVASENFKAAESRIRDADIASEAANLTRLNILQQAASSILAQANQQPALALQLLG